MTVQQHNLPYKGGREGINRVSMEKDLGETSKGSVPPTSSTESLSLLDPRHSYNNENSDNGDEDLLDAIHRWEEIQSEFKPSTSKVKYEPSQNYHCLDQLVAESKHKVKSSPSRKSSTSTSIDSYYKRYRVSEWLGGCRCVEAQDINCNYHQEPIDDNQLPNQGADSSNQTPSRDYHKVVLDEDVAEDFPLLDGIEDFVYPVTVREKKDRRMSSEEEGYVHLEIEWMEMEDIERRLLRGGGGVVASCVIDIKGQD